MNKKNAKSMLFLKAGAARILQNKINIKEKALLIIKTITT
jgi:hypothetical protein